MQSKLERAKMMQNPIGSLQIQTIKHIQLTKMLTKSTIFHKTRKTKEIPRIILLHFTLQEKEFRKTFLRLM